MFGLSLTVLRCSDTNVGQHDRETMNDSGGYHLFYTSYASLLAHHSTRNARHMKHNRLPDPMTLLRSMPALSDSIATP